MNAAPVNAIQINATPIRVTRTPWQTALAMLLVSAGALAFASAPSPALAQTGAGPLQLAQNEANLPEKSPEQKAAEKKLETKKGDLEAKLDKERDDFLKSKEGKVAREKFDKKRKEIEKKKAAVKKEKDEFENDPEARSCCNPGYKEGVLRYYDGMIRKFDEEIAKEKRKIADDEMKKRDKKRAAAADKIREEIKKVEAELKRLRDMPPLPPPGLSQGGYPDGDGVVALAMKLIGILLVTSLLIVPAAAARQLARTPEQMAALAALFAALAAIGGLQASLLWDLPSGPAIVVAALVLFAGASAWRPAAHR